MLNTFFLHGLKKHAQSRSLRNVYTPKPELESHWKSMVRSKSFHRACKPQPHYVHFVFSLRFQITRSLYKMLHKALYEVKSPVNTPPGYSQCSKYSFLKKSNQFTNILVLELLHTSATWGLCFFGKTCWHRFPMWCFFVFWAAQTKSNPLHCVVGVGGNRKSRYPKSCCLNLRLSARLGSTASSRERCFFVLFGWIDPLTYTYIHTYIYTDTRGLKSAYFHMVCWDFHLDERLGGMFFLVHSDMSRGADCKHRTSRSGLVPMQPAVI